MSQSEVIDISAEQKTPEKIDLPPLTADQDTFALAYIEEGGNAAAAYRAVFGEDVRNAAGSGYGMLALPQVAARIAELSDSLKESTLISAGIHLQELANIRDLAKRQGQLKVALQAEQARGEIGGLYVKNAPPPQTAVQIAFISKHDSAI